MSEILSYVVVFVNPYGFSLNLGKKVVGILLRYPSTAGG
ncbi:hypothetical protein AVDCRST_MAG84-663 [uncultured Microcoleus sp.]|uniref:Uncharacterized protein n=1 Tax=uncultured Microcoleus sp. TaxID=259945 RepID=A0A6J4KMX8_9CYAN|nr:hypothetical protein AVDCRST_MAG84-663 [uncultured Microcoleus sp.]